MLVKREISEGLFFEFGWCTCRLGKVAEFGDEEVAREVVKADHEDALKNNRKPIVRFFVPHEYRWDAVRNHAADGTLGQFVTDAMQEAD